jgi:hypothetical protein
MKTLPEVDKAKELMNAAVDWSAFKWLMEKSLLRQTADSASAALDNLDRSVKARWSDDARATYNELVATTANERQQHPTTASSRPNSQLLLLIEKVVQADQLAREARIRAQKTFDDAEKQVNISLAKDGCKQAIHFWELHENAIRAAEAVEQLSP